MLHTTSQERYEKLKTDFHRLMQNFNRDDLENFILTVNSLPLWIRLDPKISQDQKDAVDRFIVPNSLDWQICNEIADRQKHVKVRPGKKRPLVKSVPVSPGGTGFAVPPTMRVFGAGQEIFVECEGVRESALAFVVRTFRHFHYIFEGK